MIGGLKYFIGNWKMFGIPSSFQIIDKINTFYNRDRNNNKNYRIIIAPPFTLLQYFSQKTKNKKVNLCAQNWDIQKIEHQEKMIKLLAKNYL